MSSKRGRKLVKESYRWHRRVGVLVCLPLILISITGILLNHAEDFDLDAIHFTSPALLDWYGMTPRQQPLAVEIDGNWAATFENSLYLNGKLVESGTSPIVGVGLSGEMLVVATKANLFLLLPKTSTLVEKLGAESLPPGEIRAVASSEDRFLVDTVEGMFSFDSDLAQYSKEAREALPVSVFKTLPNSVYASMLEDWRGRGVSLWRIVLDLHSGRIFGASVGALLGDIVALCILLLVFSGLYNWLKRPSL